MDVQLKPDSTKRLLAELDALHEELGVALDKGAIADARRIHATLLFVAAAIDLQKRQQRQSKRVSKKTVARAVVASGHASR